MNLKKNCMGKATWKNSWPLLEGQWERAREIHTPTFPLTIQYSTGVSYWLNSNKCQKIKMLIHLFRSVSWSTEQSRVVEMKLHGENERYKTQSTKKKEGNSFIPFS